jgi:hypothetical protein
MYGILSNLANDLESFVATQEREQLADLRAATQAALAEAERHFLAANTVTGRNMAGLAAALWLALSEYTSYILEDPDEWDNPGAEALTAAERNPGLAGRAGW